MEYFDYIQLVHARSLVRHRFEARWANYGHCCVLLATEGRIYYQVDEGPRYVVDAPFVFWHHPDHTYRYGSVSRAEPWTHHYAAFVGPQAIRLIEKGFMQLGDTPFATNLDMPFCMQLFLNIIAEAAMPTPEADVVCQIELETLLLHLIRQRQPRPLPAVREQQLMQLVRDMQADPCRPIDFQRWSQQHGLSYSRFRQLFKKKFHIAPQQYLLQQRFSWARREVIQNCRSIQDIGYALGYESPAVFSRAFKKHIGLSAQALRRSVGVFEESAAGE